MAYYSSRSRYSSRRKRPRGSLRVVAVVLVVLLAVLTVVQSVRARTATAESADLKKQVASLTEQVDQLNTVVPQAMLADAMQGDTLGYQALYPTLKVETIAAFAENNPALVYLTFDDGPSANTATVLDALAAAGQRATFFVVGKNIPGNEALLKRMVDEGHTIGVHTYSHDYRAIYGSVDAYLEDFEKTWQTVYDACGVYPAIFRFPGGSVNGYNSGIYQQIIAEMVRRGFVYYDWSASSEDATSKKYTAEQLATHVIEGVAKTPHPIVLLHDSADKKATAQAVPSILSQLSAAGYTCLPLTNEIKPVTFGYTE